MQMVGVDLGPEPAATVVVHRCARCSAPLTTSEDWATVRGALRAHRIACPGPAELPKAADA